VQEYSKDSGNRPDACAKLVAGRPLAGLDAGDSHYRHFNLLDTTGSGQTGFRGTGPATSKIDVHGYLP